MKSAVLSLSALLLLGVCGGTAVADDELYKTKNCFACHRVDRNHLGPSFKAIAAKYVDDKGAEARLVTKIREGGVGVWGQVPMPAQPQVTEAEAVTLSRWILEQK
jgi:cytochrome c